MELIREGLLIISPSLQPTYLNLKAKEICQMLWNRRNYSSSQLPPILSHLSHQLFKSNVSKDTLFMVDYQIDEKQTIRIRACPLNCALEQENIVVSQNRECILFFLEDRNATWEEELRTEQKKYAFTERETQILNLSSQAYSYQQIAKTLQISLNTVKFHFKNIYAKKRTYLEPNKKYFEIEK
ncbi:helix-turn-helix transcriptional regulator [Aliterella atlantica]|uniref:helix-turn-helix transcriptional regulator n=1 Tax=Aliterella atlantica TaxID=1827278 RepID=UPI001364B922|nr:helix-turn-helix transcriptional regulator [Aliterella atlantica]